MIRRPASQNETMPPVVPSRQVPRPRQPSPPTDAHTGTSSPSSRTYEGRECGMGSACSASAQEAPTTAQRWSRPVAGGIAVLSAPILAAPEQSEPSRKRPFVPIARLLPYGDRRAAPDKVASSRISPNLIRNGSVALARRWGARRRKNLRISDFKGRRFERRIRLGRRPPAAIPDTASAHLRSIS
jgi:hypothetical protein